MRKLISILSVLALSLSLTSCIPSGNIVGNATFKTISTSLGLSPEDPVTISINGGIISTPKGYRVRVTKASFDANGLNFSASKFNDLVPPLDGLLPYVSKSEIINSRLKGKNACGSLIGYTTTGDPFALALFNPEPASILYPSYAEQIPAGSQLLLIISNFVEWLGYAPANSLKIGGRNLCANLG